MQVVTMPSETALAVPRLYAGYSASFLHDPAQLGALSFAACRTLPPFRPAVWSSSAEEGDEIDVRLDDGRHRKALIEAVEKGNPSSLRAKGGK